MPEAPVIEPPVVETPPAETPPIAPETPLETQWYDQFVGEGEDAESVKKVLGKYKTADDAIKSIPYREKLLGKPDGNKVELPGSELKGDGLVAAHRDILTKLGAAKDATGYQGVYDEMTKDLSDSERANLSETFGADIMAEAAELGLLPWQFQQGLAQALQRNGQMVDARRDNQDECDKALKTAWRHHLAENKGLAETAAARIDDELFRDENAEQLSEAQRAEQGGLFKRLVVESQDPLLYRVLCMVHDRLYSEGGNLPAHVNGSPVADAYAVAMRDAKNIWPNSPTLWEPYAKEKTGGGR